MQPFRAISDLEIKMHHLLHLGKAKVKQVYSNYKIRCYFFLRKSAFNPQHQTTPFEYCVFIDEKFNRIGWF